jgi:hypothetical protein
MRWPTHRAGSRITGSRASATRVICQDSSDIATRVTTTLTMLPITDEKVSVNACCASSTSLLSRLTSAPVWVREKKAIGIRWKWANTWVRMSKISPSPIRAEIQRCQSDRAASASARPTSTKASSTTSPDSCWRMPSSMIAR